MNLPRLTKDSLYFVVRISYIVNLGKLNPALKPPYFGLFLNGEQYSNDGRFAGESELLFLGRVFTKRFAGVLYVLSSVCIRD